MYGSIDLGRTQAAISLGSDISRRGVRLNAAAEAREELQCP